MKKMKQTNDLQPMTNKEMAQLNGGKDGNGRRRRQNRRNKRLQPTPCG